MTFIPLKAGRALVALVLTILVMLTLIPSARADFKSFDPLKNQKNENFCIGIGGGLSGTKAGLFKCDGLPNQQYRLSAQNYIYFNISVSNNNKCLRVKDNSKTVGAAVEQGSCSSVSSEWWLVNPKSYAINRPDIRFASLKNRYTGMCIGVPGGQIFHGADIQMFACDNASFGNQNWLVNPNAT